MHRPEHFLSFSNVDRVERPDAARDNVEERDDAFNCGVCLRKERGRNTEFYRGSSKRARRTLVSLLRMAMLSRSEIEDLTHAARMESLRGNPKEALLKYALCFSFTQIHESDE